MICYNHHDKQAVGICKNCQKGLCEDCAVDVGNGLACMGSCEEQVRSTNELLERNRVQSQNVGSIYSRNAIIYAVLGVVFLCFAGVSLVIYPNIWITALLIGALAIYMLVQAVSQFWFYSKISQKPKA